MDWDEDKNLDYGPTARERFAEDHGYMHYTCPVHGGFYSDTGDACPSCPEEPKEDPDEYDDEDPDDFFEDAEDEEYDYSEWDEDDVAAMEDYDANGTRMRKTDQG